MRILFVSTSTTIGGAEKTLFLLATRLEAARFEIVEVVGLKPPGPYAERIAARGIAVTTLGLARVPSWRHVRDLVRIIDRQRPDVVHAFLYSAVQLCRVASLFTGHRFRLVTSPRVSYRERSLSSLLVDRLLRARDALVIAECEATRRFLIDSQGYAAERVETIRNGIETQGTERPLDRARVRREHGIDPEEFVCGTAGRLDPQKDHALLLEAVSRLEPRSGLRCVIVGRGPLREELERSLARLSLAGVVQLPGEQPDLRPWLACFDVFVLSSRWEGLPNVLLEAMLHGLPVVATAVDGIPEVIEDARTGFLVPTGDAGALARRILDLRADPDLRRRIGEAARASILERFSLDGMLRAYEATYDRLVG